MTKMINVDLFNLVLWVTIGPYSIFFCRDTNLVDLGQQGISLIFADVILVVSNFLTFNIFNWYHSFKIVVRKYTIMKSKQQFFSQIFTNVSCVLRVT